MTLIFIRKPLALLLKIFYTFLMYQGISFLYSFGDNQNAHYEVVRKMSDDIINNVKNKYK